jgi:hypothetical protein
MKWYAREGQNLWNQISDSLRPDDTACAWFVNALHDVADRGPERSTGKRSKRA